MNYKEEAQKDEHICPFCGVKKARIVPTKSNIATNSFLSDKTEAFLCFNYHCPDPEQINFHKDKYWDWG